MRDLLQEPAWQDSDLGTPLPVDEHAVSVCLPTWDSVIGYEENLEKVTSRMQCGYPRFFKHPAIARLFTEAEQTLCENGDTVVVFPTLVSAQRAQRFVEKRQPIAAKITSYGPFQALIIPREHFALAMEYWRYTGEIVSSRNAIDFFEDQLSDNTTNQALIAELSIITKLPASCHFVYPTGMAAAFAALRSTIELRPGKKSLQLEFPYVDALKIQQNFGTGVMYLNECEGEPFSEAIARIQKGEFSAVFCETPSNPLLRSIDLKRISKACRDGGVLLVVDDTISSCYNVDVEPFADIITTSLTKWLSGAGNVMAGLVRISDSSPHKQQLLEFFNDDNPTHSQLYSADQRVFMENLNGFQQRMQTVNENGLKVAEYLQQHSAVKDVWYPTVSTPELYNAVMTEHGGFGGLISFTLNSQKKTAKVFDSLEFSKGPSLGTNFTLACPYTLLAHYDELDWVENCGVSPHLIRVSIGLEDIALLLSRFEAALSHG